MSARIIRGPWQGGGYLGLGTQPSAEYLATRQRLGMPSPGPVLTRTCPWCHAGPFESCVNRAICRLSLRQHHARQP